MIFLLGLAMIGFSVGLLFIARPRNGAMVTFLRRGNADTIYTLVVVVFLGLGVATVFNEVLGLNG